GKPAIIANNSNARQALGADTREATSSVATEEAENSALDLVDKWGAALQSSASPDPIVHNISAPEFQHDRGHFLRQIAGPCHLFMAVLHRATGTRHPRAAVQYLDPAPVGHGGRRPLQSGGGRGQPLQTGLDPGPVRGAHFRL